jgi:hypothetical protein
MSTRILDRLPGTLPRSLSSLTAPCYLHQANQLATTALLTTVLVLMLAALAYIASRALAGKADFGETAAAVFMLALLAALLRPGVWRAPITFAADTRGVFFVGGTDSRFVAWRDTGPIHIRTANAGGASQRMVVLAVRDGAMAPVAGRQSAATSHAASPDDRSPGYTLVPLGTQGIDPDVTRESLEALRALSDVGATAPAYVPDPGRRRWELVAAGAVVLAVSLYFIQALLQASARHGDAVGVGLAIAIAMALAAVWIVRYGWQRR